VVPVDALVEAAWGGDPPPSAERTLISHVTRLREALGRVGTVVERRDGGYRLVVEPKSIDAVRLERAVGDAGAVAAVDAVAVLREALALWREPGPFADLLDTAYPAAEVARLVELHGSAVEALVDAYLAAGDPAAAAAEAEAWLEDIPFRERLWELLVVALYRQGRQADALEAYQRAQVRLRDELGVDPAGGRPCG
jgi:DNA-binding SARP family transcriptional activator